AGAARARLLRTDARALSRPRTRCRRDPLTSTAVRSPPDRARPRRTAERALPRQADRTPARDARKSPTARVEAAKMTCLSALSWATLWCVTRREVHAWRS